MNFWANSMKPVQKILDKGKCTGTAECILFGFFWKTKAQNLQNSSWYFFEKLKLFSQKNSMKLEKLIFFGKTNLTSIFWNGKT